MGSKLTKFDEDNLDPIILELAKERQNIHNHSKTHKAVRCDEDNRWWETYKGLSGEIRFGERYNLQPDLKLRPYGDNHLDFIVKLDNNIKLSIDVKVSSFDRNHLLLVKEWEIDKCSDILVLGHFITAYDVRFLGWSTRNIMKKQRIGVISKKTNIRNYILDQKELFSMKDLDKILNRSGMEQIFVD